MKTQIRATFWMGVAAILVLPLLIAAPRHALADKGRSFAEVTLLESQGKLDEATKLADALAGGLSDRQKAHAEKLRAVSLALGRARLLQEAGLRAKALDDLEQARKGLGTEDDLYLLLQIQKERTALTEPERAAARRSLELAQALVNAGKADKALERLKPLAALRPPEQITSDDFEKALALQTKAEFLKSAPAKPGFLAEIGKTLWAATQTVAQWLFYFAVAIVVYLLATSVPKLFGSRPGTRVSLEDWTAPTDKREEKGRELTSDLASAIRRIEAPMAEGDSPLLNWDSAQLVFGTGSLGEIASLSTYVQETDVAVGPIKFNARQLFVWIASLFKPRYQYTLTGALSSGGGTTLTVEQRAAGGKPIPGAVFTASAEGDNARPTAVRAVAAQIALFLSRNNAVTDSWKSLEQLLLAEETLGKQVQAADRQGSLQAALQYLQSALRFDHANWIARFRLATVLRQLGRCVSSADQFEYLYSRLMTSKALAESPHFRGFMTKHPDFRLIVRYNEALSRCRVGRRDETGKAVKILGDLFKAVMPATEPEKPALARAMSLAKSAAAALTPASVDVAAPPLKEERRERLEILLRSLRAECWTQRIEHYRNQESSPELTKKVGALVNQIERDEEWMWNQVGKLARVQLTEYASAHMVTRNALGRAYYLNGQYRKAIKFLRWAIDFYPDAPNIAAKLNLASVYRRRRDRISPVWVSEAESLLKEVVLLDPGNGKAHYLLGRLYADPAVNKLDEAKKMLELDRDDPLSLFERARIAIERENALPSGLELLRRSFQLNPELGYRHYFVVSTLLDYLNAGNSLERRDLEFGRDVAAALKRARRNSFRNKAEEAIEVFQRKLEAVSKAGSPEEGQDQKAA